MLFGLVFATIIAMQVISLPDTTWQGISILLALMPLILWGIFSWFRERFALEPRIRLFPVVVVTALVANAIGYPLVYQLIDVNSWVTQQELVDRIIIYTLALGIIPEVLKYLVIRYIVWLPAFRTRYDAIAYGATTAVAYATVLNLHYVFEATPPPDIAAIRIFGTTVLHTANSLIIAFALAAIRFEKPSPLLVTSMIGVASLITGIIYAIRGNIANTRLTLSISAPRLLINFLLSAIILIGISLAMIFLFNTTEQQVEEAKKEIRS